MNIFLVMKMLEMKIKKLSEEAKIPRYAKPGDAGLDVCSIEDFVINPGERYMAKTGLAFEIAEGYELQVRPKSGLASKYGISIVNTPGTLDSGYRGELMVIMINHGKDPYHASKGDKIAQIVVNKYEHVNFKEVDELSQTDRGEGGFGSTGK